MLGFNYCEQGLLQDPRVSHIVDATSQTVFDWAHCVLQGVLNITLYLFLLDVSPPTRRAASFRALRGYLQNWVWPRRIDGSSSARDIFSEKRLASSLDAGIVKFSMSEGLSLVPVLRHWVKFEIRVERPDLTTACNCLLSLCLFIQLLQASARYAVAPADLQEAYAVFFELFLECWGEEHTIPKFHYMVHAPASLRRLGTSLNTLACERKHKNTKAWASQVANPSDIDNCVLREVVSEHVSTLCSAPWLIMEPHLLNARNPPGKVLRWLRSEFGADAKLQYSTKALVNRFENCAVGDVVAIQGNSAKTAQWHCGRVWFFCSVDDKPLAIVGRYSLVGPAHHDFSKWEDGDQPGVVSFGDIQDVLVHTNDGNVVTVLHSYPLRCKLV